MLLGENFSSDLPSYQIPLIFRRFYESFKSWRRNKLNVEEMEKKNLMGNIIENAR
jgi:hypothetical protein